MKEKLKPFPQRIYIYFKERFPFFMYLIFVSVLFLSLSFITQILSEHNPFIDKYSIIGILTTFFIMLLIRTFDDIKDEELDDEIFPNRPVPRGDVLIKDVKILSITSFVILVLLNVVFTSRLIIPFSILMLYALLTFKWFFAKEIHIKQPKIAMITHQPLPFAIVFFLILIALASGEKTDPLTLPHFLLFLVYSLPITAWEVSRKIKSKENENKYETFSKIFGTNIATTIPIVLYTVAGIVSMWIADYINLHYSYHFLIVIYLVYLNFNFIRFLRNPIPQNNNLQKVAMFFTSSLFITLITYLLIKYSIVINL